MGLVVTADDLNDWIDENGEDIIVDGPYDMSESDDKELYKRASIRLQNKFGLSITPPNTELDDWYSNVWDNADKAGLDFDDVMGELLEVMAEVITDRNIQLIY